jgi:hypothetical protein
MLDEYLKVAYAQEVKNQDTRELEELLAKLPHVELRKIADGTPVGELFKTGSLGPESCSSDKAGEFSFLSAFKGTPLFDQAVALEQEELQLDMLQQQREEERRAEGDVWQMRDKVRLKKRLLELELAKSQNGGAPPDEPAQGAGAPGPVPAEGVQDNSQGLQGGVAKLGGMFASMAKGIKGAVTGTKDLGQGFSMARSGAVSQTAASKARNAASAARTQLPDPRQVAADAAMRQFPKTGAQAKVAFADAFGRTLAKQDFAKAAHARDLEACGALAGEAMAKMGLDISGIGKTVAGLGTRALGMAAKNPAMAGAALGAGVGAIGGAAAGGPGNRLGGALGGAALGGAVGGGAGHIAGGGGGALGGKLRGMVGMGGAPAAAAPAAALKGGVGNVQAMKAVTPGGRAPTSALLARPGGTPLMPPDPAAFQRPGLVSRAMQGLGIERG